MKVRILYGKPKAKFVPISWLIRIAEGSFKSPMLGSHIAIEFRGHRESAVFDSISPRSRLITSSRWREHYYLIKSWPFEIADGNASAAVEWALQNTDLPYSRWQCVLIGLGELFGGWVRKLTKKQNPNGSAYLICVEAAARFSTGFLGLKFESGFDVIGLEEFVDTMDKYTEK